MFVFGLIAGPILGLIGGDALMRATSLPLAARWVAAGIVLAAVLFFPVLALELRIALVGGMLLGLLLAATPAPPPSMTAGTEQPE